jgi:hypothetical protein
MHVAIYLEIVNAQRLSAERILALAPLVCGGNLFGGHCASFCGGRAKKQKMP